VYHAISDKPHAYGVTRETFVRHISFIRQNHTFVRLKDIKSAFRKPNGLRPVIITFDDAYTSFFEKAFPILEQLSIPCTVFVPTGYIGGRNEWDRQPEPLAGTEVMSKEQLRALDSSGWVDIGSHSVDHVRMSQLSIDAMSYQVIASKRCLEELLGHSICAFSYPYGQLDDFSTSTCTILADAGYDIAVTTHWGTLHSTEHLLRLRRISVSESDTFADIKDKLEGQYDWIAMKERVGYIKRCFQHYTRRWASWEM